MTGQRFLVLVLSLLPVSAFAQQVWVQSTYTSYPTIGEAAQNAINGDILVVTAGTYVEPSTIVVDKDLQILGAEEMGIKGCKLSADGEEKRISISRAQEVFTVTSDEVARPSRVSSS